MQKSTKIRTHGVKYLGSKRNMLPQLRRVFDSLRPETALDVFTGTTRVAQMLRSEGVRVTTSDVADYSRVFSRAWVSGRYNYARIEFLAGQLSRMQGKDGWFTKTYCDVPGVAGGVVRFMTPQNGRKVDAIRDEIDDMLRQGKVTPVEADALIAALIIGMDRVDNTVGLQQAYLKKWCTRSQNPLTLEALKPPMGPVGDHVSGDVLSVSLPSADVAYIDPPYNGHVYLTNYHIWESIVRWDKPKVALKTNRRVDFCDGKVKSKWNVKHEAPLAFAKLLQRLDVRDVIISYAAGSHILLEDLVDVVAQTHDIRSVSPVMMNENIMSVIGNGAKPGGTPQRREWIIHASTRG